MSYLGRIQDGYKRFFVLSKGFTLIEVLVAMAIFLVFSVGITSTMLIGIRSTVVARLDTMGKEAAQQQMEAIRGRTFYIPYSNDPDVGTTGDVDILDRYYPGTSTGHVTDAWGWDGWYSSGGGDAYYTVVSPEDNNGIVITVETRFVDNAGNTITPRSTYDSDVSGYDSPASDLIAVTVTASWLSRNDEESYTTESLISRADQSTQGGSAGGGGEAGCSFSSNSSISITAGTVNVYTGTADPYTSLVGGTLGKANGTASYDCESSLTANSTGGELAIDGGSSYAAANTSVVGPPDDSDSSGPLTIGPTSVWPRIYFSNTRSSVSVDSDDVLGELTMAADAELGAADIQLQQIDGGLSGTVNNFKRWDFINPAIAATNGSGVLAADAEIVQDSGTTTATGQVNYGQINFLPLERYTTNAPRALQGLVIIRNFQATAVSEASETDGSASNSVTYYATIGMFNSNKAASCSGDACYDFYNISPSNPIQSAVNLNNADYKVQKELITEWHSYTTADINSATYAADDGSEAMVSIDALLKISSKYAVEVRQRTNGQKDVQIITQEGLQKLWLGTFDISVLQNA